MFATKLRVIAWTQRRCFRGLQFTPATPLVLFRTGSSGGPATRQISAQVPASPSPRTGSAYLGRVFLPAPGYTRELRKTQVVVRPHHDHLLRHHPHGVGRENIE